MILFFHFVEQTSPSAMNETPLAPDSITTTAHRHIKKKTSQGISSIPNVKDTKCIKMLFTVSFFLLILCRSRLLLCLKSEESGFIFNSL